MNLAYGLRQKIQITHPIRKAYVHDIDSVKINTWGKQIERVSM